MAATSLSEKKYTAVGQQDTYDDEAQMAEAPSRVDLDWRKDAGLVQESRCEETAWKGRNCPACLCG